MKILMVNKFFHVKGGSETYYFALKKLYESLGHQVIDFSTVNDLNEPSPYAPYFVQDIDYHQDYSLIQKIQIAGRFIYSSEAKEKMRKLIQDTKPDVIHLHLYHHQISPSILDVMDGIPCIYTAHDLQMLCPNYQMMHDGVICEECIHGSGWPCIRHRCVMNSLGKSALSAMEYTIHRKRNPYRRIHCILTPSEFYRRKFLEAGFSEEKVFHIPNFIPGTPCAGARLRHGNYLLYAGRLSEEKGLMTLLKAAEGMSIPLHIVGTGPMEASLRQRAEACGLTQVVFYGFLQGEELKEQISQAKAVVLPSEWYENGPYSLIEALSYGRPVIAARIGGLPEMIDGNGILFSAGDADQLSNAMRRMQDMPFEEWALLSQRSAELFQRDYTETHHLELLRQVYGLMGMEL